MRGDAAGARHENLTLVLGVEIDEHVAIHKTGLKAESSCKACLLVNGEEAFYGAVGDVVAVQDGKLYGHAYAVVGAERRATGFQPLAIDISVYGVGLEIELNVNKLVAHHVHVALKNHGGARLVTGGGRLANQYVASGVHLCRKATGAAKVQQVGNHFLLVFRGAGDGVDLRKLLEYAPGVQLCLVHFV